MYRPNFTVDNKTFCLSLLYNGENSKAQNSELIKHSMCLGGLSLDYHNKDKVKYTGLYGNVYDFSVDYSAITDDKVLEIHN